MDWKNPGLKLKSFKAEEQGNRVQVVTTYELPRLAAVLTMTYLIGGNGEIRISEQLAVDKEKKDMPHLFRFGMQLVMPGRFDRIDYYGRGPVENYDDRNESQRLGRKAYPYSIISYPFRLIPSIQPDHFPKVTCTSPALTTACTKSSYREAFCPVSANST